MRGLSTSPRARRRLAWFGVGLGIVGAIAGVALLIPNPKQPNPAPPKNAPPAQVVRRSTHVTRAERRAISATLGRFLRAGLDRSSPATAWRLAGPELKTGSTLRQWRHGTSPIPYFPARNEGFNAWTPVDAGPRYVVFDHLVVHPRHGPRTSAWIFSGEVVRSGSHWLVNRLYTIAIMRRPTKSGTHQLGPADFAAPTASASDGSPPRDSGAILGKAWLLAVVGVIGLAILFPIGLGVASGVRSRRRRRQYALTRDRDLPPLPRTLETSAKASSQGAVGGPRH
jgi:hypothetical protein